MLSFENHPLVPAANEVSEEEGASPWLGSRWDEEGGTLYEFAAGKASTVSPGPEACSVRKMTGGESHFFTFTETDG